MPALRQLIPVRDRRSNARYEAGLRAALDADASAELTAVVFTVEPNPLLELCLASIEAQQLPAGRVEVVRDVQPASLASQRGLERVATPYYASVDGDLVLKPTCFARLYQELVADPACAEVRAMVLDPILGEIECVRMYRTEPVRAIGFHPFEGEVGHDRYMTLQLERRGHRVVRLPVVEADHHPVYQPYEAFWKFRMTGQKALHFRRRGMDASFETTLAKIVRYWQRTGDEIGIYSLAGLFAGLQVEDLDQELTYEGRLADPQLARVRELLERAGPDGGTR